MQRTALVVGDGKELLEAAKVAKRKGFITIFSTKIPEGSKIDIIMTKSFDDIKGKGMSSKAPNAKIFTRRFYADRFVFENKLDEIRFARN